MSTDLESACLEHLIRYYILNTSGRSSTIVSPQNLLFFKFVQKHLLVSEAVWNNTTLFLNGKNAHKNDYREQLNDAIAIASALKKQKEISPIVHDTINVAQKLLKFVRWCLDHPFKEATLVYTFPRTRRRLALIVAARGFMLGKSPDEELRLLKTELKVSLLAPVSKVRRRALLAGHVPEGLVPKNESDILLFQTPDEYLFLDFYELIRWPKQT